MWDWGLGELKGFFVCVISYVCCVSWTEKGSFVFYRCRQWWWCRSTTFNGLADIAALSTQLHTVFSSLVNNNNRAAMIFPYPPEKWQWVYPSIFHLKLDMMNDHISALYLNMNFYDAETPKQTTHKVANATFGMGKRGSKMNLASLLIRRTQCKASEHNPFKCILQIC